VLVGLVIGMRGIVCKGLVSRGMECQALGAHWSRWKLWSKWSRRSTQRLRRLSHQSCGENLNGTGELLDGVQEGAVLTTGTGERAAQGLKGVANGALTNGAVTHGPLIHGILPPGPLPARPLAPGPVL
jgi:hypothetical protein